eukprot:g5885.t1
MMKNIENHVQQQMRKNMMGKLTNNKIQSGKTSKAMVLKTRGHIHSLITKRAKDLRLARQDLETRMHQCHQNHKATEYDHILKASDVHFKTNLDCHKNKNHPRKDEMALIQVHEAIMSHYNFVSNPYLDDLVKMKEIKYNPNVPMSNEDLKLHRDEATAFLERTTWGAVGNFARKATGAMGRAVKNVAGKVMKAFTPGTAEVQNLNEVMGEGVGVVMETVDDDDPEAKVVGDDDDTDGQVDQAELKHLTFFDILGAIIFGLANGFFAGMIEDFRKDFSDKSCAFNKVKHAFEDAVGKSSALWTVIRSAWKNVWGKEGRAEILEAIQLAFKAYKDVFIEIFKWMYKCKGTRTIAVMIAVIGVALGINAALMAAGGVVIPIILKLGALILELITSAQYVKKLVLNLVKEIKAVKAGTCHKSCKKNLLQYMSEVVGFLVQIVVMSGIKDVVKFAKPKGAKIGKISWNPDFVNDLKTLQKAGQKAGAGVVNKIKSPFKGSKVNSYGDSLGATADDIAKGVTKNVDEVAGSADDVHKAGVADEMHKADAGTEVEAVAEYSDLKERVKKHGHNDELVGDELTTIKDPKHKKVTALDDDVSRGLEDVGKTADEAGWKTKAGENTGGKGTAENPMSFDEAKQSKNAKGEELYAYDRYSDNIPKEMLKEQDNFIGGRFNEIKVNANPNSDEVITLYRAGDDNREFGQYWTRDPPNSATDVAEMAAVKTDWSNTRNMSPEDIGKHYDSVVFKKGSNMEGMADLKPREIDGVLETKAQFVKRVKESPGDMATTVYKLEIPVKDLGPDGVIMFEGKVASQADGLATGIDRKALGGGDQIFLSGKQPFAANRCANCKITKVGGFEESRQLRTSLGLEARL